MTTEDMARDHIRWAHGSLGEAREALRRKDYPRTVRRAQECVELSVKAVLRALGIEYPKEHDVSDVLRDLRMDLPGWFEEAVPLIADIMAKITPQRGPAMYGMEGQMKPAGAIFSEEDALRALKDAEFVYDRCSKFLEDWLKECPRDIK